MKRTARDGALEQALGERIVFLDGGMGTEIQMLELDEAAFRGERFADHPVDLRGNNDILCLTKPDAIRDIHAAYFAAGADIVETNTFNATRISQGDYGLEDMAYEINRAGAQIAREAADAAEAAEPGRRCFVAGSIGPTARTASISPDVNDPGFRNVSFDELRDAYYEAARGLLDGGSDLFFVETVFDTLNAKAAVYGIDALLEERGETLPLFLSGTITDLSGRTLSGQTTEAFWNSLRHARPLAVGLNCALGPAELRPYLAELSRIADVNVSVHPNAGLPNEFGGYDETPERMTVHMREWAESGLVNIVGGCCGTTPAHIRALADAVRGLPPRPIPEVPRMMRLAGLEPFTLPAF